MARVKLGLLLVILLSGCVARPPATTERPPAKVVTVTVSSKEITDYDEYVGRTEPSETVEVRARVTGYIKSIEFQDGQLIEADQPLFKIEPDIYEAAYQQSLSRIEVAKAEATLAQSKLKRAKSLIDVKAISPEEYEENVSALTEAQARSVAAEADARTTALDLKYTVVSSPISGRIDRALVTPGNIVTGGLGSGTLLTTIVKNEPLYVYFDVDERSALRYQRMTVANRQNRSAAESTPEVKSQSIRDLKVPCFMRLMDETDFSHEGVLDFLQNRVDGATGSVKFRASFPNTDRLLKGGMFVRVKVPVSTPYQAILVPEQSIGVDQGQHYVVVVGDDKVAARQRVEIGRSYGSWRIITQGLSAGQQVVVKGLQRVRPGQRVEPEMVTLTLAPL